MEEQWKAMLSRKFGGSLERLETTVRACPPHLWQASVWPVTKDQPWVWPIKRFGQRDFPDEAAQLELLPVISAFWNVAYHAIFHVDFYLSGGNLPFKPPAPFREEEHRPSTVPARTYTPEELLKYLAHCRRKARSVIGVLTDESAAAVPPRHGLPFLDLLFNCLMHTREHAAQLELFLGQHNAALVASPAQALRDAVRERSDHDIDTWAAAVGGYPRLLPRVLTGFATALRPNGDATVAFEVGGERFAVRSKAGKAGLEKRPPPSPDATVTMSRQDFLRWMGGDAEFADLIAAGRAACAGDPAALGRLTGRQG